MTDKSSRSLPPLVEGNIYGYLRVTIDEVLWSANYPGDVAVLMQWWGDIDSISLRPSDISKYPEKTKEDSSVLYIIQTNFQLFETYLKQWNKLKLLVINDSSKEIVGHVYINHLHELITGIQYEKYFPIITSSGIRIGDLRVDFELTMNSVPEERASKKMRKRSRRKNKSNQGSYRHIDEDNLKQIKRGCKSCSEYTKTTSRSTVAENKLNLEPLTCKVPPNTQRSDTSECALWEVLDKSKKLRDAMVLSVLDEDSPDLNEKLLLEPGTEVDSKTIYEPLKVKQNGEVASLYEETLINKYIEGKAMKEEEEILVLNVLHGTDLKTRDTIGKNKEDCCQISENHLHSIPKQRSEHTSEPEEIIAHTFVNSDMNKLLDKVNCFRLTIDNLTLTKAGWKKINQSIDNKNKNYDIPPPGATYFVECHFVEDSPRSVTQLWKTTPLRFCSRRQIENVVYFGQSCAQSLRPQAHIAAELAAASCVVCWRHLHQRVPARLGNFSLADIQLPSEASLHASATLAVFDGNSTVAHLRLSLTLGRDKLLYGEDLLNVIQENKEIKVTIAKDKKVQINDVPLRVTDLSDSNTKLLHTPFNGYLEQTMVSRELQGIDIPQCSNCCQNLALSGQPSTDTTLCTSCIELLAPHRNIAAKPNFILNMPENLNYEHQRHHKFLIGIDSVVGFPLFAGVKENVSCYVDYKFPEIASSLKVTMSQRETTSRVVACEPQVSLSSIHAHHLPLPVALPLSPLLDACSPGVTLRLWLRYYHPSPRDHMVAMALLPMDVLCLLELEFDQKQEKSAVSKVLELPLALVPSSVTAPYQKYRNLGMLRVTVTYSNHIKSQQAQAGRAIEPIQVATPWNIAPINVSQLESNLQPEDRRGEVVPIDILLDQITATNNEELRIAKNRFWTEPFGKERFCVNKLNGENEPVTEKNTSLDKYSSTLDPLRDLPANKVEIVDENSCPVMKEDFNILAESLEQRFNQLQSDLMKKKQQELSEQVNTVTGNLSNLINDINDDGIFAFNSLSSNSSMESLPFILGPPADFKDTQNEVISQGKKLSSETQSEKSNSDTISGFLKEERSVANLGSNEVFDRDECKFALVNPKTFKAKIKIDRAVNLKAIKGPCNGKKGKLPPSTWVSFGTGDCCEQNCDVGSRVCSGVKYSTPVVRKNYNPVWNLAWDVDLPVDYLTKVNKRLVFRVFEENLNVAFGFASANVSILTSGLPSLSSWLSINDLTGACKGQIKIIVTPLEDVSKYQDCSVFDIEEDEFEEFHEKPANSSSFDPVNTACFVASQTEIVVNTSGSEASNNADKEVEQLMQPSNKGITGEAIEGEDQFSADDVISDYKNTLENNFRNEMAGLDNLIKFLKVGSMSNELSFLQSTENKENVSYNPNSHQPISDIKASSSLLINQSVCVGNESSGQSELHEKVLIDASTETSTTERTPLNTCLSNSEDILTKLLQQFSMFQLPTVKISDNTCQTVQPETRETFTETSAEKSVAVDRTVHMKDATTETEDICDSRPSQPPHVCGELGTVLLQHFLTCKPATVKVIDSSSQTETQEKLPSTAESSGIFMSSCMSSGILRNNPPFREELTELAGNWISPETALTNSERLISIDNNIKDLERFLKKNLILTEKDGIPPVDSIEGSLCESLNCVIDPVHANAKHDSQSSSDIESSESYSQQLVVPRETPDGGSVSTIANNDNIGITLRRQGTYVIQKSNSYIEETLRKTESRGNDAA